MTAVPTGEISVAMRFHTPAVQSSTDDSSLSETNSGLKPTEGNNKRELFGEA